MLLPEGSASTLLMLGGLGLLIFMLLRRSHRSFGRLANSDAVPTRTTQHGAKPAESRHDAPAEMIRWEVEMHDTARGLKAELDSKLSMLQTLVGEARCEAERIEAALARAEMLGLPVPDALDEVENLAAETQTGVPGDSGPIEEHASGNLPGSPDQRRGVYSLSDQGRPAADIADRVGLPLGEVEMLLGLRS